MLSSELRSVCSLRRFLSVGTEYAAVVSHASVAQKYPYICRFLHKCQTNLHEKFQRREFHTSKEKVFTKVCALLNFYSLPAHCNAHAASCYSKSMAMAATMNKV